LPTIEDVAGDASLQRFTQVIRLSPEHEAEYIRQHQHVWPGVLRTIADCNMTNYSIFLRSGLLFAYFEYIGDDFAADMQKMSECPDTQRWWALIDPMQSPVPDASPNDKWSRMREVFHYDPVPKDAALERAD
jgi:L-rhamnose mutarotase